MTPTNRKLAFLIASLGIVIIVLLLVAIFVPVPKRSDTRVPAGPAGPAEDWATYRSEKYGFEIQHPADWTVAVTESAEPKINIYRKAEAAKPPFIHHNNVTQVSIFPKGIGTEGVDSESAASAIKFREPTSQATDFLLGDGSRWATYATFQKRPASWEPFGFVWAGVQLEDPTRECRLNGEALPVEKCDLGVERSEEAKIVLSGGMKQEDREIEERMLESFFFWQMNVSGEIVCLPHKAGGPQTEECAIGLRGEDGRYYGLVGLDQSDIVSGKWTTGVRVLVSGELALAPDSQYEIVGNISVQDIADAP